MVGGGLVLYLVVALLWSVYPWTPFRFCDVVKRFLPLLSTLVNHTKTVRGKQVFCMISRDRGMQYGRFVCTSQIKVLNCSPLSHYILLGGARRSGVRL